MKPDRVRSRSRCATSDATATSIPQLVWRGKDEQDWSDLVVHAPPLYIQEKVHPKALIDDLLRSREGRKERSGRQATKQLDLFADFNGIPKGPTRPSSTPTTRTGPTA
jgi:hypothetical protein